MGDSSLMQSLIALYDRTGTSSIGLKKVPAVEVSNYGNVEIAGRTDVSPGESEVAITRVIEKPKPSEAVSDIVIIGRYVLAPSVFDHLATIKPSTNGEIQLTDALALLANENQLLGIVSDITRYDTGTPMGLLRAVIEIALGREDIGPQLQTWLENKFSN
jgi:UTP--glucose-1-phosphate uridylyltransferase